MQDTVYSYVQLMKPNRIYGAVNSFQRFIVQLFSRFKLPSRHLENFGGAGFTRPTGLS